MQCVMLQNSDSNFEVIEMALRKNSLMYALQDFSKTIKTCRKNNKFILTKIKCEDFFAKTLLEEAIHRRLKVTSGEPVTLLRIYWMRFIKHTYIHKWPLQHITSGLHPTFSHHSCCMR